MRGWGGPLPQTPKRETMQHSRSAELHDTPNISQTPPKSIEARLQGSEVVTPKTVEGVQPQEDAQGFGLATAKTSTHRSGRGLRQA